MIETVEDLELLDPSLSSERLVYRLFHERGVRVFKSVPIAAQCSCSRDGVGTVGAANSAGLTVLGDTAMTTAASGITQMNTSFENNYDAQVTVSLASVSTIDNTNPFSSPGIQGPAFGTFAGGVQQVGSTGTFGTFGEAGSVEFALDLYRIAAKTGIAGEVDGPLRTGTFEGTVTVGSNGMVSFVPEPSSLALAGLSAGALVLRRRRCA